MENGSTTPNIRHLTQEDSSAVWNLQNQVYPPILQEDHIVFKAFISYYQKGCWGIWNCNSENPLIAYVISFPWTRSYPVPLNGTINQPKGSTDCYYLHDLAIHPKFQGFGWGKTLVLKAISEAEKRQFEEIRLVSVQNSQKFWKKFGFIETEIISYGKAHPASLMRKIISNPKTS